MAEKKIFLRKKSKLLLKQKLKNMLGGGRMFDFIKTLKEEKKKH